MPKMHFCENFRFLEMILYSRYCRGLSVEISRLFLRYLRLPYKYPLSRRGDVFFKEESFSKKILECSRNDRDHRKKSLDFSFAVFLILQTLIIQMQRCIFQRRIFFEKILEPSKRPGSQEEIFRFFLSRFYRHFVISMRRCIFQRRIFFEKILRNISIRIELPEEISSNLEYKITIIGNPKKLYF